MIIFTGTEAKATENHFFTCFSPLWVMVRAGVTAMGISGTILLSAVLLTSQILFADVSLQLKSGQKIACQEVSPQCPFYKCADDSFLFGPKATQHGLVPTYQKISSSKLQLETPKLITDQNNKIIFQNKSQFQYSNKTGSGFLNYFRNSGIHLAQSFALNKCPEAFKADYRKKLNDYTNTELSKIPQRDLELPVNSVLEKISAKALAHPVSIESLTSQFQNWKTDPRLRYDYVFDGCFARSHLVASELEKQNIIVGKVWLHGFNLKPIQQNLTDFSGWFYHVAVVVLAEDQKIYVIDPGLFNQPVSVIEWVEKIKGPNKNILWTQNIDQVQAAKKMEVQLSFSGVDMYPSYSAVNNAESVEQKIKDAVSTLSDLP